MPKVASPHLKSLVFDALLSSFWRKSALQRFLRDCGIAATFVGTLGPDESKRAFLERLFVELQQHAKGGAMFLRIADDLAEQAAFPDLHGWEDTPEKLQAAQRAVKALRDYLRATGTDVGSQTRRAQAAEREQKLKEGQALTRRRLLELNARLTQLASRIGSQQAGYEFQVWFYDLMGFCEVVSRPPYVAEGRQIDGTVSVEGTTYLVELKFTQEQVGATDIDSLAQKVVKKADNTIGVMVSMSGYSTVAKSEASGPGSKLLLLDFQHIHLILAGHDFSELLSRVRRHASQTGQAYLDQSAFG